MRSVARALERVAERRPVFFDLARDVSARPHRASRWSRAPFDGCARARCHDAPALRASSRAMSDDERFWFDTNGFLILRNVFSSTDVAAMREAIDARVDSSAQAERTGALRLTRANGPLSGDGVTGRRDVAGFLGWPKGRREKFREVLSHPRLAPYLHELLGPGYRLDHNPLLIQQAPGAEGFEMHGGAMTDDGKRNWPLGYAVHDGEMRCELLAVTVALTPVKEGEGGFVVVRGSHKSAFPAPKSVKGYETAQEHGYSPVLNAGDVVLFSEATTHGTLAWRGEEERRTLIYRFAPATSAYGRGYAENGGWPESWTEGMTPAQLATLQPPYHPRLDRESVAEDGVNVIRPAPREAFKVKFDEQVFGSKYF